MTKQNVLEAVRFYLDSQKWHYGQPQEDILELVLNVSGKISKCRIVILIHDSGFTCYTISPLNADEESRPAVAEYLTRANYGLRNGNFELDYSDGEVRYKVYLDFCGQIPPVECTERSIDMGVAMFKRYGDGLLAVMVGGASPRDMIAKAEGVVS